MSGPGTRPVVVVTRSAEQSDGLTSRLREAGYDVLEVPVISIVDAADGGAALAAALARLESYDWLVLTSPNGAQRVRQAVQRCAEGQRPKVAVVGPGTAEALGGAADLMPAHSVGEGLVEAFPAGTGRVLLVQAEAARPVVGDGLRALGWNVDAVVGYRTIPVSPPGQLVERAARSAAVVFTSGSTVRSYLAAAGMDALPRVVVSIGPVTTGVAESLGVRVRITAPVHNLDGIVDALRSVVPPNPAAPPGSGLDS